MNVIIGQDIQVPVLWCVRIVLRTRSSKSDVVLWSCYVTHSGPELCVAQAVQELENPPLSASQMLGSQTRAPCLSIVLFLRPPGLPVILSSSLCVFSLSVT